MGPLAPSVWAADMLGTERRSLGSAGVPQERARPKYPEPLNP